MGKNLDVLKARLADSNALHAAVAIMDWDQQTLMPKGGAEARAHHVGILSRMAHEVFVADETLRALEGAKGEVEEGTDDAAMLRVTQRDLDVQTKIPASLVEEKSMLSSQAHEAWVTARATNTFTKFAPTLEKMFEIAGREAECLGYKEHIYDALTDMYEEGATKNRWDSMFDSIRQPLVNLVKNIKESNTKPNDKFLYDEWPIERQGAFTETIIQAVGFSFERGRQDTAPHPFCTGWSVGDIRLTTRFKQYLPSSIMGSLHEAGHGMYEQGSPMAWDRTPLAGGVSLGVHESQSRTWENIVGRSKAFWQHFYPSLQQTFPALESHDLDEWYRCLNKVEPSLIRVEADEVTYNLHVMVRFELECDLLTQKLAIKDLPDAWNAKYESYLGVTPPSDSEGCLQDVHWSMGSIGYFPTYSMGNLLSYQIWNVLKAEVGDVDALMAKGDFQPILAWLQKKIYSQGRRFKPGELVEQVTGKPLGATDYLDAITAKYGELYGLSIGV